MGATPIPPHVIQTVFQYLLPPSLPLPPHLLSKPLTERHHFLSISPTDHTSYLCWPSSNAVEVAEALESSVPVTPSSEPDHEVRYTTPDKETALAHVRPDAQSPLQIVFAWDAETATWRYHDTRMLPFPDASVPSLDAAPKDTSRLQWPSIMVDQPSHTSRSPSPSLDTDDYWAGYESSESSPDTDGLPTSIPTEEDDKAEAAYWASYAAVHGSGDSTVPSPKFEKRRLAHDHRLPEARGPETTFDPFVAHLHLRLQQEHGFLLSHEAKSDDTPFGQGPQKTTSEPVGSSRIAQDDYGFPKEDGLEVAEINASEQIRERDVTTVKSCREDREDGLREAIKGIYRLWKTQSGSEDAGTFIDIVKDTLKR